MLSVLVISQIYLLFERSLLDFDQRKLGLYFDCVKEHFIDDRISLLFQSFEENEILKGAPV